MKKSIEIIILVLALSLIGCQGSVTKSESTEPSKRVIDDSSKAQEEVNKNDQEKTNIKTDQSNNKRNEESKKQEYKTKLDNIELGFEDFDNTEKTTKDMRDHANERYKQWDDALNEIYGVLKRQLSASDMKNLQNEEIQWIKNRDSKASEASSKAKGGTLEPVLYVGSLAQSTKERCYELVDKYIK
jgi:uncharacterized protein YecT (DUF1311 family)